MCAQNRVAVALQLLNPNSTNSGSLGAPTMPTNPGASFSAAAADLPPRLLVLTQTGGLLIVDIEGFQVKSAGFYTVKVKVPWNIENYLRSLTYNCFLCVGGS